MCLLCQATASGVHHLCTSTQLCGKSKKFSCSAGAQLKMTWSKESIGNTTVEKTPSKNGSRRKKSAESVIRRRRPSSTRIVPRARSIESVRRKYSPKKQLTVYSPKRDSNHSLSTSYERDESPRDDAATKPPKDENSPGSTSKKIATVRRSHAFRRSSHYRRAFRERTPRVLLPMYNNNATDTHASSHATNKSSDDTTGSQPIPAATDAVTTVPLCTGDASDEECSTSDNTTQLGDAEVCTLEAVVVSFADDDDDDDCGSDVDVGPEPIVLQTHTTCAPTSTEISPREVGISGTSDDIGPEPIELLDTAVDIGGEDGAASRGTEKRPSILKRVLSKSSSLMKKTMSSRRSNQGKTADMKCCTSSERRRRRAHMPTRRMIRRPRKVVIMGDMFSGKSSLVSAYCHDRFSTNYVPTLLNTLSTDAKVFGESIELVVVDVGGRDDYAKLRKCAYHKMDIIILCYAADSPDSLRRIVDYWVPEIKRHCPKVPFILVATKKDIRDDALYESSHVEGRGGKEGVVLTISGKRVAETVGAQKFLECSARYRDNTRNVFEMAAKVALQKSRRKRK